MIVVALVLAYLVGSIPMAVLVGRAHGIDPRDHGDANPGYWNIKELLGRRAAVPVMIGDTAKGFVAGAFSFGLDAHWGVAYALVGAAMIGHAYPVFARFRGGRSVLTFVGGVLAISPIPAGLAIATCVVVSLGSRRFDVGARVGVAAFPLIQAAFDPRARVAAAGALMTLIGIRFVQAALAERRQVGEG